MRPYMRLIVAGIACMTIGTVMFIWLSGRDRSRPAPESTGRPPGSSAGVRPRSDRPTPASLSDLEAFPDPNAPGTPAQVYINRSFLDGEIFTAAIPYTGDKIDSASLLELREAIGERGPRGLAALLPQYGRLKVDPSGSPQHSDQAIRLARSIAFLHMHGGKLKEATEWLERALELSRDRGGSPEEQAGLHALLGIAALRKGELANCLGCVGPSSCIFPISPEAVHRQQAGSREAMAHLSASLALSPGDLRVRWLLNIVAMTLGEYPDKVPRAYLIAPELFRSKLDLGRFDNVALSAGLTVRGANLAGGSIFDDFDGDGLEDLFTTSVDVDRGASLFKNRGDGTFLDRSEAAGLAEQVYALNAARADFDNDGNPDVLLLRGAWERPARMSLLRNKGGGAFEDVTLACGLGEPISTLSAVWGDYDNDGRLDLFVCGEFPHDSSDPRNLCRLYHNERDGTFKNVALEAGVTNERIAKGSAWGDYDGDGRVDLFVSNIDAPCRLYHNEGDGTFRDVASLVGVAGPPHHRSFSCWFWDFDNDDRLDLFVNDYNASLADVVASYLGLATKDAGHPRLYRNLGPQGFQDVSTEVGLDRPIAAMGANFGDIDNDGYLDAYFGTGWLSYSGLVPNVLLRNVEGRQFVDITESSGTGHLQKGHGVAFGDWDCDGDQDLFVSLGGGYPGDQAYSALFQNPGHGRHYLKVRLIGKRTNRSALGAILTVQVKDPKGGVRSIHRVIGNNGSFGGNSLVETIGLGTATSVDLTVRWPTSKSTQSFRDIAADQAIEITEGAEPFKVLRQRPLDASKKQRGQS
jgi:FG-GAP-like repeat/ASPIC and UnbV